MIQGIKTKDIVIDTNETDSESFSTTSSSSKTVASGSSTTTNDGIKYAFNNLVCLKSGYDNVGE